MGLWHSSSPIQQPLKRSLNRLARKHSKWPIARVWEEGKEENVFAEHTAYREERAKLRSASSRRGVKAAFRVQEQG